MAKKGEEKTAGDRIVVLQAWYLRVLALCLLVFGLQYWIRLSGYHAGDEWRFDTMPEHWRLAATSLAVAFPVAALGLWGHFKWGLVIWLPAIAGEAVMYGVYPQLYGEAWLRLAFHAASLLVLLVFAIVRRFRPPSG